MALAEQYFRTQVAGQAEGTVDAKQRDLAYFLTFYTQIYGHDDRWEWFKEEARAYLRSYAEGPAETVTAVVVTHTAMGVRRQGVDRATVWFRRIPEEVIDQVIARGDIFAHAGGFSITDPLLEAYIERVGGTAESVIGLPSSLTRQLLRAAMAAPVGEDPAAAGRGEPLAGGTSGP